MDPISEIVNQSRREFTPMVHGPWSIVYGPWSMVHGLSSMQWDHCIRKRIQFKYQESKSPGERGF
jgi:hypothetical protein